ncbi:MAG: glutamyl-tRNA reductase [Gemmatimonadales bacterium]
MPLACVGVNHRTAPVALREHLALGPEAQRRLLRTQALQDVGERAGLAEFVILSTCNRTEVYAAAADARRRLIEAPEDLVHFLVRIADLPAAKLQPHTYRHAGSGAVRHLCSVAAGLDSMVLGESEILGQVETAYETSVREGTAGPLLEAAFRAATRAGRRARTETGICRLHTSVSKEAIQLLADVAGPLERLAVLIVGTGKMGRLAGAAFHAHGGRGITVVSRTAQHAETFAGEWGATALAWHDLPAAIRAADAIVCSTGAPHAVVTRELVERAVGIGGDGRRRVFVDIAVPRDVEPEVGGLPEIELYDIDALQQRLRGNLELRRQEMPAVERIVDEEVARFEEWRHGLTLRPLLSQVRARSETIRQRELQRMLRRLGDVSPDLRAQLETFSQSLVNKLLHEPTRRLREARDPERVSTYTTVARELFGLDDAGQAVGGDVG